MSTVVIWILNYWYTLDKLLTQHFIKTIVWWVKILTMINFAHDFGPEIQHVTFLLPFFIFTKFNIRQSKRLNLANTWVLAKFKRFDWRIVNCAKIKNGNKNVTPCRWPYGIENWKQFDSLENCHKNIWDVWLFLINPLVF